VLLEALETGKATIEANRIRLLGTAWNSLPLIETGMRDEASAGCVGVAEHAGGGESFRSPVDRPVSVLRILGEMREQSQRSTSSRRSPLCRCNRTTSASWVGATFQLGPMFGFTVREIRAI